MRIVAAPALILAMLALVVAPAHAAVNGFTVVNQTGGALTDLALRRIGDPTWQSVNVAASPAASARVNFAHKDCAFDLRANIAGVGPILWSGVNLCDVKRVTLNRDSSGRHWVDYD